MPTRNDLSTEPADASGQLTQEPLFRLETWEELLDTPERLEWLLVIGTHYRELFDDVIAQVRDLAWHEQVAYLIDFDVLRSYLEVDSFNRRPAALVYSWFHYSTRPYALPVGALEELKAYLRRMGDIKARVTQAREHEVGGQAAVRVLAQSLGVSDVESLDTDDAVHEIVRLLDSRAVHLGRLADFLTNERFVGVASDYNEEIAEQLTRWISDRPRKKEEGRRVRDERDARNIAIAVESARRANIAKQKQEKNPPSTYFLVTATSILLEFSKTVKRLVVNGDRSAIEFSETMHDIFSEMEGAPAARHYLDFPVIHPRHGTVAELTGVYDSPREAVAAVKQRRQELWEITEYCEDLLDTKGPQGGVAGESLAEVIGESRDRVARLLQKFGRQFLIDDRGGLARLEDDRAAVIAAGRPRGFLGNDDRTCTSADSINEASTRFLAQASNVEAKLAGLDAIQYRAETSKVDTNPPYARFEVFDNTDVSRPLRIAAGELFAGNDGEQDDSGAYAVFRFPTYASPAEFFRVVEEIVFPLLPRPVELQSELQPIANVPECWKQGLLIHTRNGTHGAAMREIAPGAPRRSGDLLGAASELVESLRVRMQVYGSYVNVPPTIEQYRVNTLLGDYLFDVECLEGEVRRYCAIVSHMDLAESIAKIYGRLGIRYIVEEKFAGTLRDAVEECRGLVSPSSSEDIGK